MICRKRSGRRLFSGLTSFRCKERAGDAAMRKARNESVAVRKARTAAANRARWLDHVAKGRDPRKASAAWRRWNDKRLIAKHKVTRARPNNCEICGRRDVEQGHRMRTLCLDHDHNTGLFRGWLCRQCNSALGLVKDNPVILERLIAYLNGEL